MRADVKRWMLEGPPSVTVARPAHCPGCGAASRPLGAGVVLHGHGLRARTVITHDGRGAKIIEVRARRYVCRACGAVVLVVPADVARRCMYTLAVIAAALARWSHAELSARAVRALFSAFAIVGVNARGWPSLVRWSRMALQLWPKLRRIPNAPPRAVARVVSGKLAAFAPVPTGRVVADCVNGCVHAC